MLKWRHRPQTTLPRRTVPTKNDLLFAASTTPARWPNYILYTIYTENTQEDSSDTLHEYDDHNTSNPYFLAHYHGTKKNLPPPVTSNTITTISNKTTTATTTTTTKETTIPPTTLNCTPSGYSTHQNYTGSTPLWTSYSSSTTQETTTPPVTQRNPLLHRLTAPPRPNLTYKNTVNHNRKHTSRCTYNPLIH